MGFYLCKNICERMLAAKEAKRQSNAVKGNYCQSCAVWYPKGQYTRCPCCNSLLRYLYHTRSHYWRRKTNKRLVM